MSQFDGLSGSKSRQPVTQVYGSVAGSGIPVGAAFELAKGIRSLLDKQYCIQANGSWRMLFVFAPTYEEHGIGFLPACGKYGQCGRQIA